MRLVLVEWLDSYGCSSEWQTLEGSEAKPLVCRSVGWLLHDKPDCKVIVPHVSEWNYANAPQQGCGDMTIPTKSILNIFDLSEPSTHN